MLNSLDNIMEKGFCQYHEERVLSISWGNRLVNIMEKGFCQYHRHDREIALSISYKKGFVNIMGK